MVAGAVASDELPFSSDDDGSNREATIAPSVPHACVEETSPSNKSLHKQKAPLALESFKSV